MGVTGMRAFRMRYDASGPAFMRPQSLPELPMDFYEGPLELRHAYWRFCARWSEVALPYDLRHRARLSAFLGCQ